MSYSGPSIIKAPPGPVARSYIEKDHDMLSPSLTRTSPLVASRAEGVYVEDVDGNVFLDFGSGIAVTALGHRHPEVIEAVKKQLDRLIFVNSLDYYTLPQIEYAEMLFKHTPGDFKKRIFYCNSGSEAVDTAIKLAKAHTRRCYGIGYINGFHGRTIGAISMTTTNVAGRRGFGPMYPIAQFVPYPYCYRCMFGREYPSCGLYCMNYLTDIMFKKIVPPDETAYVIIEPVQGAGGYIVPPVDFMQTLAGICAEHGIMLIADEVQSGFGRTGKMFASEHFGIEPDILTCSKAFAHGLPAGAAVSRAEVMDWEPGAHEGTLNGGPVIIEAAKTVLRVMERDRIVQRAEEMGGYFRSQLEEMKKRMPCIGDVRGLGLMIGVELIKDDKKTPAKELRNRLIDDAFARGLLLLAAGESSIRLAPPLIITRQQIDTGLSIIEDCLKKYL